MILLTGASGFLGKHFVRFLSAQGYIVRALYHKHPPSAELQQLPGVSWQQCDLLDIYDVEDAMQDIKEIYHCAAVVSFNPRRKEDILLFNVECTTNIVNLALEQGIHKMLHISSVAALGRTEQKNKEITEDEEWEESRENSSYGISKYMAEMEVWRGIGEGLNAVIVNPGIILGEGNWDEGSPQLFKIAYNEFPFYTEGVNAWVDVRDVVNISHMLIQSDIVSERFILSGGSLAYKDIFVMMSKAFNKKPPRIKANTIVTGLVWRLGVLKSMFSKSSSALTKETARNAQNKCYYNSNKLLKFFPSYMYNPVEQTINRISASFMNDIADKK